MKSQGRNLDRAYQQAIEYTPAEHTQRLCSSDSKFLIYMNKQKNNQVYFYPISDNLLKERLTNFI